MSIREQLTATIMEALADGKHKVLDDGVVTDVTMPTRSTIQVCVIDGTHGNRLRRFDFKISEVRD